MQTVSIDKLKIKDGLPVVSYTATDAKGKKCVVPGAEYTDPVHIDLQKALDKLNVHLALSTSMLPISGALEDINDELLSYYHMHGVSIKEDGITLSGHKILPNKKAFNFNSPFIRFSESEETQYTFIDELIQDIERVQKEVTAYLDGSKRADEVQLSMDFNSTEPVTKAQIVPPVATTGTFKVQTVAGEVELPILPENGVIAEIEAEDATLTATFTKGNLEEEPFERKLMEPFEDETKPVDSTSVIDKKGIAKKVTVGRTRKPQTPQNPSGE